MAPLPQLHLCINHTQLVAGTVNSVIKKAEGKKEASLYFYFS